ncbi:MAG: helix-turn-helix domain-containing protein [Saprospiraceae bacterium]|jgi:transcriptional regulator with XRE-family HTH domain|nr:helix-turn-helix domain-containing protein [Saprospiraceae bacterium]MBK7437230.1 helix-turn-helix domain-containing protein [Saprospiraceae bacterium]MBK7607449.1 helix-turn-helix domain-containing protein [Saprospiraceae bacterium]MBK8776121.1 helix-turn-helix domain-containing protein [Saprospiraceae bacterium]MBK9678364.1 helix-turn-helix domain-containing protein [Saprospiraceae bacterium]
MFGDNLKYLREVKKISQQQAADDLGLPRTTLGDYERNHTEPNITMLCKIAGYFHVDLDDLLKHQLEQLHPKSLDKDFKILAITLDPANRQNIELVDAKAEAGYLQSFQDPQYIKKLPRIYIPRLHQGSYRAFEIRGDSMLPVESGTLIIGQYVEKLSDVINDKTYIIIHKTDGIVYKRVRVNKEKKELQLVSDNTVYDTYSLPFHLISELWEYKAHIGFNDLKSSFESMMDDRLSDVQKKVNQIYKKVVKS